MKVPYVGGLQNVSKNQVGYGLRPFGHYITLSQKESGEGNFATSDKKSDRSVRKADQRVTKNENK